MEVSGLFAIPDLTMDSGVILRTNEKRGEAFLHNFILQTEKKDIEERKRMQQIVHHLHEMQTVIDDDIEYITVNIIKSILKTYSDTVPGPDGVRYSHINCMEEKGLAELCKLFSKSIHTGIIPDDWLHSYLRPLPKLRKDLTRTNGYCIIFLQNAVSKLFGIFIDHRVSHIMKTNGLFPSTLCGYRPGKDT
uniref:Reverse transcriptase domain-containing protein n=1 Tax=Arion vulgaris TaxID=1028688 RepID=A0A0B7BDH0_9EUPU